MIIAFFEVLVSVGEGWRMLEFLLIMTFEPNCDHPWQHAYETGLFDFDRSSQHFSLSKNRHTQDLDYYGYLMSRDRYLRRTLARRLATARANDYEVVDLNPPHSIRSKGVSQPEVNPTDIILIDRMGKH